MNMLQYDLALYNNMNVTGRFNVITWMLRDNLIYWQRGLYLKELSVKNQLKKITKYVGDITN